MSTQIERLTIHTRPEGDEFLSLWRLGRKQGMVYVKVDAGIEDREVVAELCALHHLVEDVHLLGDNRNGLHLELTVSNPVVLDIRRGKSKKKDLYAFAVLLMTKFKEVPVVVDKDCTWLGEGAATRVRRIEVTEPPKLFMEVKGYGRVSVRQHAFEQFRARLNQASAVDAWREMQRVGRAGMVPIRNEERGSTKLFHAETYWVFVVADDGNLVTSYPDLKLGKHALPGTDTRVSR